MTFIRDMNIRCPSCQSQQVKRVFESVNVGVNPELKVSVLQDKINCFSCRNCQTSVVLKADLLYHDPEKRFMVHLLHDTDQTEVEKEKVRAMSRDLEGFTLRCTHSMSRLIEKVRILSDDLDNRAVEVIKIGLLTQLNKESTQT